MDLDARPPVGEAVSDGGILDDDGLEGVRKGGPGGVEDARFAPRAREHDALRIGGHGVSKGGVCERVGEAHVDDGGVFGMDQEVGLPRGNVKGPVRLGVHGVVKGAHVGADPAREDDGDLGRMRRLDQDLDGQEGPEERSVRFNGIAHDQHVARGKDEARGHVHDGGPQLPKARPDGREVAHDSMSFLSHAGKD